MRDGEIERLRTQLKLLQRRLRREALPVPGVSLTAARVLGASALLGEEASPRKLAEEARMTSSNVAAALRELERAGLVTREQDPADGRRVLVVVTEAGRSVVAARRRERDTWLGRAIGELLDEREQEILVAAGDLLERLAGYEPPASGPAGGPLDRQK
jgi:DNA-binding MarR family transcriptional regulator